jgi:hypothetical protein
VIPGITVVIPAIPPRAALLKRAVDSVTRAADYFHTQIPKAPPGFIRTSIAIDHRKLGAARTRHRALVAAETKWVAFLDDDDEMLPDHLFKLYTAALEHRADYVWSRFRITYPGGACVTGPSFLGEKAFRQWDDDDPCQTTITTLVRTKLALEAGGFAQFDDQGQEIDGQRRGEDFEFTLRCRAAGGEFRHVPEVTWLWHHHGIGAPGVPGNTSGLPERW